MKFYFNGIPVLKLGSHFYWNGKKYKVTRTAKQDDKLSNKNSAIIGVKLVEDKTSNS